MTDLCRIELACRLGCCLAALAILCHAAILLVKGEGYPFGLYFVVLFSGILANENESDRECEPAPDYIDSDTDRGSFPLSRSINPMAYWIVVITECTVSLFLALFAVCR